MLVFGESQLPCSCRSLVKRGPSSARKRRAGVVPKDAWFSTLIPNAFRFDGNICLQTSGEDGAIGEFNVHLWTIGADFVDSDEADNFAAEFFA
jgi:hypothetical protein